LYKILTFSLLLFLNIGLNAQSNIQINSCEDETVCLPSGECFSSTYTISVGATTDCNISSNLTFAYQIDLHHNNDPEFF